MNDRLWKALFTAPRPRVPTTIASYLHGMGNRHHATWQRSRRGGALGISVDRLQKRIQAGEMVPPYIHVPESKCRFGTWTMSTQPKECRSAPLPAPALTLMSRPKRGHSFVAVYRQGTVQRRASSPPRKCRAQDQSRRAPSGSRWGGCIFANLRHGRARPGTRTSPCAQTRRKPWTRYLKTRKAISSPRIFHE